MNAVVPRIMRDSPEQENQYFRLSGYTTQKLEVHHLLYGIDLVKATAIPHRPQVPPHQSAGKTSINPPSKWHFTKR
jgi:hypothetical protein